jgi:hypothetical protein
MLEFLCTAMVSVMRSKCVALVLLVMSASPAVALEIEFFDVGAVPMAAERRAAFELAAASWEREFVDPISVRINIGFNEYRNEQLGVTQVQRTTHSYTAVRSALALSATSFAENQSFGALPTSSLPIVDIRGGREANQVTLSTANAKALGLATGLDPFYGQPLPNHSDASIQFNEFSSERFDFDPSDGIDARQVDFVALASREIGHALGFNSMVDLQDWRANYDFEIQPSTLDFWRFPQSGQRRDLGADARRVSAAPAEFYDGQRAHELSWGRGNIDNACDTDDNRCAADYWRDSQPDLMTPTLPVATSVTLSANDLQALDAIGYERPPVFNPGRPAQISRMVVGWFKPAGDAPCLGCELPQFESDAFDDFAPAPPFAELPRELAGEEFSLGVRIGIDLDADGFRNRSGIGFASFREEIANRERFNYEAPTAFPDEQNLLPAVQFPETLPPSIMSFYFRSDTTAGDPFTFIASLGEDGAPFDPTLGEFGGYRITGFVDTEADGVLGDRDGQMTFFLAVDENGDPDGEAMNIYELLPNALQNNLNPGDDDGFDFGPFVPGDTFPFDGKVDLQDLNNVRNNFGNSGEYGLPGDTFRFDGVVDLSDLNEVRNNFGAGASNSVPEPSTLYLAAATLLVVVCHGFHKAVRRGRCLVSTA